MRYPEGIRNSRLISTSEEIRRDYISQYHHPSKCLPPILPCRMQAVRILSVVQALQTTSKWDEGPEEEADHILHYGQHGQARGGATKTQSQSQCFRFSSLYRSSSPKQAVGELKPEISGQEADGLHLRRHCKGPGHISCKYPLPRSKKPTTNATLFLSVSASSSRSTRVCSHGY